MPSGVFKIVVRTVMPNAVRWGAPLVRTVACCASGSPPLGAAGRPATLVTTASTTATGNTLANTLLGCLSWSTLRLFGQFRRRRGALARQAGA